MIDLCAIAKVSVNAARVETGNDDLTEFIAPTLANLHQMVNDLVQAEMLGAPDRDVKAAMLIMQTFVYASMINVDLNPVFSAALETMFVQHPEMRLPFERMTA